MKNKIDLPMSLQISYLLKNSNHVTLHNALRQLHRVTLAEIEDMIKQILEDAK